MFTIPSVCIYVCNIWQIWKPSVRNAMYVTRLFTSDTLLRIKAHIAANVSFELIQSSSSKVLWNEPVLPTCRLFMRRTSSRKSKDNIAAKCDCKKATENHSQMLKVSSIWMHRSSNHPNLPGWLKRKSRPLRGTRVEVSIRDTRVREGSFQQHAHTYARSPFTSGGLSATWLLIIFIVICKNEWELL